MIMLMSDNVEYKTLYKSMGLPEWRLIRTEGRLRFPPRMLRHKLFYPSLQFDNACEMAKKCHTVNAGSEYCGVVVGFDVPPDFLSGYAAMLEGDNSGSVIDDMWLSAADCQAINDNLLNPLRVVEVFYRQEFEGVGYTALELNDDVILL